MTVWRLSSVALVIFQFNSITLAAPAFSPNPAYHAKHRHYIRELDLNPQSSCNAEKGEALSQYMYDKVDTHNFIQNWMNNNPGTSNFVFDFAQPLGVGQSFGTCSIGTPCQRPNCNNLDNPDGPQTAAGYNALVCISNLSQFLDKLYSSYAMSSAQFATLQLALQDKFYPANTPDTLATKEFLTAGVTAVNMIGQFGVFPTVKAGFNFLAGILTGIKDAITASDKTLDYLRQTEEAANEFVQGALASIVEWNDGFMSTGVHNDVKMLDIFEGGPWLDYRNVPILNTDASKPRTDVTTLNKAFFTQLMANLVNFCWKKQHTYLMSYPMTQEEFDSHSTIAGSNDFRLKMYYGGRGFFFQSMQEVTTPLLPTNPKNINPPGWGDLGEYDIDTHDIIRSSADAFNAGGFSYNPDDTGNNLLTNPPPDLSLPGVYLPGVFTLPHCQMFPETENVGSLDGFFELLDGPDDDFGGNKIGYVPSFCFCMDLADPSGKKFSEAMDFGDWTRYCTQNDPNYDPGPSYKSKKYMQKRDNATEVA